MSAYDDEEDEVDEVVKRMSIHDVVHDVYPAFQSDDLEGGTHTHTHNQECLHLGPRGSLRKSVNLKDGDPGVSDVVEVNGSFVWVDLAGSTLIVKLVPVHTRHRLLVPRRPVGSGLLGAQEAGSAGDAAAGHVRAPQHPVLPLGGADEGMVVGAVWSVVAAQEGDVVFPGGKRSHHIEFNGAVSTLQLRCY